MIARRQRSVGCLTFRTFSSNPRSSRRLLLLGSFLLLSSSVGISSRKLQSHFPFKPATDTHTRRSPLSISPSMRADVLESVFFFCLLRGTLTRVDAQKKKNPVMFPLLLLHFFSAPVSPCLRAFLSWLRALEFPEYPHGTHLVATYCIVTPFLAMVHTVLRQSPLLPFYTSLFCTLTKNFPLLLNTHFFFIIYFCDTAFSSNNSREKTRLV